MGYRIIEISENKVENLAEKVGKMLCMGEQVMECINDMAMSNYMGERNHDYEPDYDEGIPGGYGERSYMGERGRMGMRMGMRRGGRR